MTTIVYKEEMITSTASSGAPNVQSSKTVTVKILSDDGRTTSGNRSSGAPPSNTPRHSSHSSTRRGSPKPNKKIHNVREGSKLSKGSFSPGYSAHPFVITAYLPYDGGKRLKVSGLGKLYGHVIDAGGKCGLFCHFCVEVEVFSLFRLLDVGCFSFQFCSYFLSYLFAMSTW